MPLYAQPPPSLMHSPRVRHTQLRIRMLDGAWADDYGAYRAQRIGTARSAAWGAAEVMACPLRDLADQVSVLYVEEPAIGSTADPDAAADVLERWRLMNAQQVLSRAQFLTEALNECAVRVDVLADGRMSLRPVTPDYLDGDALHGRPGSPGWIGEWLIRETAQGPVWVQDHWDLRDPGNPRHTTRDAEGAVVETLEWPAEFRRADGSAVLPYSLRHSMPAPLSLWNPYYRRETVGGTLRLGVLSDMIDHSFVNAAFRQKYGINAVPLGAATREDDGGAPIQQVAADPASILLFQLDPDAPPGAQASLDQFDESAPIADMQDVYERRLGMLAQSWGINPANLVRASPNPSSGVALSLSRAGIREVQRQRAPLYRDRDEQLAALTAIVMNRLDGGARPESGYRIRYQLLPLSQGEQDQLVRETMEMLRAPGGPLLTPAEARARITGEDLETARAALASVQTPPQTPEEGTP